MDHDPLRSLNGMQPSVWGPPLWFFLHTISLNYPPEPTREQQVQYYRFFVSLGDVLPCKHCRESYATWIEQLDLNVFRSRATLAKWVYDLHNTVNIKLGKPAHHESFSEVLEAYHAYRGGRVKRKARVAVVRK